MSGDIIGIIIYRIASYKVREHRIVINQFHVKTINQKDVQREQLFAPLPNIANDKLKQINSKR